MDKLNEQKVKTNSRYQRDMERSFAVIYHNLKRIRDEKSSQDSLARRRRHSEPQLHAPNPAFLQKYENVQTSGPQKQRRVSFSSVVNHTSIPATHENGASIQRDQMKEASEDGFIRRSHSDPQSPAPIPSLLLKHNGTVSRDGLNSETTKALDQRAHKRKVNFSDGIDQTLVKEFHRLRTTDDEVCDLLKEETTAER